MTAPAAPAWSRDRWFNAAVPLTLDALRGRVVMLHAFQMLCPGCVSHGIPQAQRVARRFADAPVTVVGLHTVFEHHDVMGPEALEVFLHEYRVTFRVHCSMNCRHGLDERFCSICQPVRGATAPRRPASGDASLDEILEFLNHEQVRATYGAVADVLGVIPRSLGARRPAASWVVSTDTGLPTDYSQDEWHPALLRKGDIIKSGTAF